MSHDDKDPIEEFLPPIPGPSQVPRPLGPCRKRPGVWLVVPRRVQRQGERPWRVCRRGRWQQVGQDLQLAAYIDKETVPNFEKATGIKAEYTEDVNDNNEFFAKISEPLKRGQSIDRDIIVLTDWMAGRLIRLGYVAPLDEAKFPHKANLEDNLRDVSWDSGRKYSVPWLSGMTGIGYNPKKTGRELTSIHDIFDPKFKGKVTMLTEMRDSIGLIMLGDGKDPAKATKADVAAAAAKIKKYRQNGHIRAFTGNDYAEDLAAGNIAVAIAWSGDIQGLAADNPDLRWIAPKEGAMLFSDNMMIPKTSERADAAMAWINYVYDPVSVGQDRSGRAVHLSGQGSQRRAGQDRSRARQEPAGEPPGRHSAPDCTSSGGWRR